MKTINFMFDYTRKFKTCVVFKNEQEANEHAGDTLQSWIDDYNKHTQEFGLDPTVEEDPAITAKNDYLKSKETLKKILQLNKVSKPVMDDILGQIKTTTLKREYEWYGLIASLKIKDNKLADSIVEDMNYMRDMVENKKCTNDNVFEKYAAIKAKKQGRAR